MSNSGTSVSRIKTVKMENCYPAFGAYGQINLGQIAIAMPEEGDTSGCPYYLRTSACDYQAQLRMAHLG
jgi:hypothetical protein